MRRLTAVRAGAIVAEWLIENRKAADPTRALLESRLEAARKLYRRSRQGYGQTRKINLDGLPRALRWLIGSLVDALGSLFGDTQAGRLTVSQWYSLAQEKIAEYHLASFMAGNQSEIVPDKAWNGLVDQVNAQLEYLTGFKAEIQAAPEFAAGWQARAESYAGAIKQPYWSGKTKVLPLPAMPAQGTQCGNNCKCLWRVETVDEAKGDYDAFWERHADDSCQTCLEREAQWSPVQIRDGVLL